MSFATLNPATEEPLAEYAALTDTEIETRLDRAEQAFLRHRRTAFADRAAKMQRAADLLERRAETWGAVMTQEMGKPLTQAITEAKKCAWVCRYYADHAEAFLADEAKATDATRSLIAYEPLGPILAVMPWNFPFWQVFRFAAPALMAGNVALLKHAPNVFGCAQAIADIFQEAGFDNHEFQSLVIGTEPVAGLLADRRVKAATLTGSTRAGTAIGAAAGKNIKPSVLELGGSDAFIVLADADLDAAVETGLKSRMQNNGQSCIAAKRFILDAPIAEAFTARFLAAMEAQTIGDPMDTTTDLGPLARADLRDTLHRQVTQAIADGATLATGGAMLDRPGFFYPPTVLTNVEARTVAFEEELFGPVAAVTTARDADDAVALANASPYGLGATIFTEDTAKGEALARRLEVGGVFINGMVKSDPRLPFGGIKASGYGRELADIGMRAFVNIKTIWVR